MNRLIAFTLKRRITVLMMAAATALVGGIAYNTLPLELLPSGMENVNVSVWIPVPTSNPTEVLEQVVKPTEEEIRTIPGIKHLESGASPGRAFLRVVFSADTDINLAAAELRDRIERARVSWPEQVKDYRIFRFNMDTDIPILTFAVDLLHYTDEVTFLVEEKVIKPLEALPGVARVTCFGLLDDQIRIYVDRDRALAQNVPLFQLTQALRKANVEVSGGEVEEGQIRYSVRTDARILSLDDLRRLPVNERGLTLGQIARIEPAKAVRDRMWLSRNKRSLFCMVMKESAANTVETASRVRSYLLDKAAKDPRLQELGGRFRIYEKDDFGLMITSVLNTLKLSAAIGAMLALLVLFFFLRRIRLTLIITISIPLSLLITLAVIYFSGNTLNVLTMLGMTIAIGMLIDNSIVVAENIARHRDMGASPYQAALKGASEVGLAVLLSTLTTVAVFLPLIFMSNEVEAAFYLRGMGKPLGIAVLASLLVALVFIPLGTAVFYGRKREGRPALWRRTIVLDRLRDLYGTLLGAALKQRLRTLLIILSAVGGMTAAAWMLMPEMDIMSNAGGRIRVGVALDRNFTLSDSYKVFKQIGDWVEKHMKEYEIQHYWCSFDRTGGQFRINLDHTDVEKTRATAQRLKREFPLIPGVKYRFGLEDQQEDDKKLSLSIFGPDPNRLLRISREVAGIIEETPGVLSVTSNLEEGQEELHIIPDREKALRYGVDPRWLRGTLEYGIRGLWFSDLIQKGREIPMIIQFEGSDTRTLAEIREFPIPTRSGGHVPLSAVADLKVRRGFADIHRRDGRTQALLTIETGGEQQRKVVGRIKQRLASYELPEGYSFRENKGEEIQAAVSELTGTILLAITFVFLLMGVLFESFILPLAVLCSIPLSWAGAVWALGFTGTQLDLIGGVGVIVLVGIVVNNGIVLLDCSNRLLAQGRDRWQALVEAGRLRFRPILMTASTTIVGLVPMAIMESGQSRISYRALALTVMGGLTLSTFLTLFMVPILYTLLDDLRLFSRRFLRALLPAPRPRGEPAA